MSLLEQRLIENGLLWRGKNARKSYSIAHIERLKEKARTEAGAELAGTKQAIAYHARKLED